MINLIITKVVENSLSFATLLFAVMQLLQYRFQLVGNQQAEMGSVLQDGEAVVCKSPIRYGGAQDAGLVQYNFLIFILFLKFFLSLQLFYAEPLLLLQHRTASSL